MENPFPGFIPIRRAFESLGRYSPLSSWDNYSCYATAAITPSLERKGEQYYKYPKNKASGISELLFNTFVLLMQPIHLAIGIVEGFVTAAVVTFVWKARPEVLEASFNDMPMRRELSMKKVLVGFVVAALFTGGILSWFASSYPDGLEWSMARTAGVEELDAPEGGTHGFFAGLQEKLAFLPDYGFRRSGGSYAQESCRQAQMNNSLQLD